MERITIRLDAEDVEFLNRQEGKTKSEKIKNALRTEKNPPSATAQEEIPLRIIQLVDEIRQREKDGEYVPSREKVMTLALEGYKKRMGCKILRGYVFSYDELIEELGLNKLDKNVQSRKFLEDIEVIYYGNI